MKRLKFFAVILILSAISALIFGCLEKSGPGVPKTPVPNKHDEGIVTLYFADDQANLFLVEERKLKEGQEATPKAAINALIEGPELKGHFGVMPKGTELLGIEIKDKVAYVDFNSDFKDNYMLGSAVETMTVYSIVSTLTRFPEIEKVKFLVEGEPLDIVGSNFDFTIQTFERDENLIDESR